jgi:hypothetical protein
MSAKIGAGEAAPVAAALKSPRLLKCRVVIKLSTVFEWPPLAS